MHRSRLEAIYITLGSYGILEGIILWEVSRAPSFLDHRHIMFILRGFFPALLIRNPRGTNWCSFLVDLRNKLERELHLSVEIEAGLGLAVQCILQALVTAYEDKCILRPTKNGRKSLRWTSVLASLRMEFIGPSIGIGMITSHSIGNSTLRLKGGIGRRYLRLPEGHRGPSVSLSMTYIGLLCCIGPCLWTLQPSWESWWLVPESARNPREKPWIFCLLLTHRCLPIHTRGLASGC